MHKTCPRILLIDNYDSYTYNLVQLLREDGGCFFDIVRNDSVDLSYAATVDGFLFSPGPGIPSESPVMNELLSMFHRDKSFLGICLGHQAIAEFFGMKLIRLKDVRHGLKASVRVTDGSDYLFEGLPSEFSAGLYHSWAVDNVETNLATASDLRVTAQAADGVIMALAHNTYDIRGVQFHPESYLTEYGQNIIHNWIRHLSLVRMGGE